MDKIKTILCFGDSNTWGKDPISGERYSLSERWPGILRQELGRGYWIIEEGLSRRTTVWPDPLGECSSGKDYFIPCLKSHQPLDLVIIFLGTNDLKFRFSLTPQDIANGAGTLVGMALQSTTGLNKKAPHVLLLCPPPIADRSRGEIAPAFYGAESKSQQLGIYYRKIAEQYNCHYYDTGLIISSSNVDGIHLERTEHAKLGKTASNLVRKILE